jgi:mono/diheme cytochrome c family protein
LFNAPMPPSRDLPDAQVAAVLTYIRASWGNTLDPVHTDEVARVRSQ